MARSIKEVFEQELKHLSIDSRLVRDIGAYERNFVNRSEDHVNFLGGVLMGTPPLRFHQSDRNAWFDDILKVDDVVLKNELHDLRSIDPSFKVSSDPLNLSVTYLLHALHRSQKLSARQKEEGMINALKVMHYRFLSSLMSHYFRYEPDREVVEATYAALSYKFALKREGSWAALIDARCRDIISKNGIHYRTIDRYDNDDQITYILSDTQGRIREIVKKMYRVFVEVHQSSTRVKSRGSMVEMEGEMHVRDLVRNQSTLKRYAHDVMSDKHTYIRPELTKIVADAMHTMPERHLNSALEYMVDNYGRRGDRNVAELIDEVVLHALDYLADNRREFGRHVDLAQLLSKLRSLYMSSRSTDRSLLKMRDLSLKIVKKSVRSNNSSLLASVRTGVMLYVVLRTLTMKHFSSSGSLESIGDGIDDVA
jgi:hypothetical protein